MNARLPAMSAYITTVRKSPVNFLSRLRQMRGRVLKRLKNLSGRNSTHCASQVLLTTSCSAQRTASRASMCASLSVWAASAVVLTSSTTTTPTPETRPGINTDLDRYLAVTAEDVRRAAKTALGENMVRLTVLPEEQLSTVSTSLDRTAIPGASPSPTFSPPVPTRATLSNGIKLVLVEKPGLPVCCAGSSHTSGRHYGPHRQARRRKPDRHDAL